MAAADVLGFTHAVAAQLLPPAAIVSQVLGTVQALPVMLGFSKQRVDIETPLKSVAVLSGDPRGAIAFEKANQERFSREERAMIYRQLITQLGGGPALRQVPRWRHMIVGHMVDQALMPERRRVVREQARAVRASRRPSHLLPRRRVSGPPTTARAIARFGTYSRRI